VRMAPAESDPSILRIYKRRLTQPWRFILPPPGPIILTGMYETVFAARRLKEAFTRCPSKTATTRDTNVR